MDTNVRLVQTSFLKILPQKEKFVAEFYARLFTAYPQLKSLFMHTDMRLLHDKLLSALTTVVNSLRDIERMAPALRKLGKSHATYNVQPEYYAMAGEVLLATLADCLGEHWTPELRVAWTEAYGAIVRYMTDLASPVQSR